MDGSFSGLHKLGTLMMMEPLAHKRVVSKDMLRRESTNSDDVEASVFPF